MRKEANRETKKEGQPMEMHNRPFVACGGTSLRYVQRLPRHRDLNTTDLYTHIELQDLQQAIEVAANRQEAGI